MSIPSRKPVILVVDDEEDLRATIVFDLKRKGYEVYECENGRKAYELASKHEIDVILSDVRMPDGDGIELLDRMKAHSPKLPVFMFITGFADISLEEAYAKGADAIFSKPFDRKELLRAVERATVLEDVRWSQKPSTAEGVQVSIGIASALSLGRGGMFAPIPGELPTVGGCIGFQTESSTEKTESVQGTGIVRWIRGDGGPEGQVRGAGIEFTYLEPDCRLKILNLIARHSPRAFIPKA